MEGRQRGDARLVFRPLPPFGSLPHPSYTGVWLSFQFLSVSWSALSSSFLLLSPPSLRFFFTFSSPLHSFSSLSLSLYSPLLRASFTSFLFPFLILVSPFLPLPLPFLSSLYFLTSPLIPCPLLQYPLQLTFLPHSSSFSPSYMQPDPRQWCYISCIVSFCIMLRPREYHASCYCSCKLSGSRGTKRIERRLFMVIESQVSRAEKTVTHFTLERKSSVFFI